MGVSQDVIAFMNALPEAVMLLDRQGRFMEANSLFYEFFGIVRGVFNDNRLYKLPFTTRNVERGLIRLFVKAFRGGDEVYSFSYARPDGDVTNVTASARRAVLDGREYVIFNFNQSKTEETQLNDSNSWKYCMEVASEPYLEFRPAKPVTSTGAQDSRLEFLHTLGESLRVKFSNNAASKFYENKQNSLEGKTFISFFSKESDAIGFLDMLSVVGRMESDTKVNTSEASDVSVRMECMVRFDDGENIAALYCSQRDLSDTERYKTAIGAGRQEMDFMYNQPFVGFAFLVPPRPLERPPLENLDGRLDEMLNQIVVVRANQAMFDIHGSDKTMFLMKPMRWFFSDAVTARQTLKELFVMRETSYGWQNQYGDDFDFVSVFRAMFDNSDRLSGVLLVTSKYSSGYHPRHIHTRYKTPAREDTRADTEVQRPPEQGERGKQGKQENPPQPPALRHTYDPAYDPFSFLE